MSNSSSSSTDISCSSSPSCIINNINTTITTMEQQQQQHYDIFQEYLESPYSLGLCDKFHLNLPCDHDCMMAHPPRRVRIYLHENRELVICCKMFLLYNDCSCFTRSSAQQFQMKSNKNDQVQVNNNGSSTEEIIMTGNNNNNNNANLLNSIGCDLFYHPPSHIREMLANKGVGTYFISENKTTTTNQSNGGNTNVNNNTTTTCSSETSPSLTMQSKRSSLVVNKIPTDSLLYFSSNRATIDVAVQTMESSFKLLHCGGLRNNKTACNSTGSSVVGTASGCGLLTPAGIISSPNRLANVLNTSSSSNRVTARGGIRQSISHSATTTPNAQQCNTMQTTSRSPSTTMIDLNWLQDFGKDIFMENRQKNLSPNHSYSQHKQQVPSTTTTSTSSLLPSPTAGISTRERLSSYADSVLPMYPPIRPEVSLYLLSQLSSSLGIKQKNK